MAVLLPVAAALASGAGPAAAQGSAAPTTATASVSPATVNYGAEVSYTLTVTSSGTPVTSGAFRFQTGNTILCGGTSVTNGVGACSTTHAPAGADQIIGIYFGNALYGAASATASLTVNVPPPPPPGGATGSVSNAGTDHLGQVVTDLGDVHTVATGAGAVTVATYGSNPTGSAPPGATGTYADVATGTGSGFTTLVIAVCPYGAGSSLQWFDRATGSWIEFSAQEKTIACLFATVAADTSPSLAQLTGTPIAVSVLSSPSAPQGYWLVAKDGGIFSFHRPFFGSTGAIRLNRPIVGMAATNDENGYWMVGADGGIFAFGDAVYQGSLPARGIATGNVVAIVSDPTTNGYYIVGSNGAVVPFNAPQLGDLPYFGFSVNNIVGGAMTPDDKGMYLVGADGKVYVLLGDGHFQGDASSLHLNAPIVDMKVDPLTGGYWLLGQDGGVFSYNAPFYGSTGNLRLNQPVIAMSSTGDGGGYWFTATDGGVFSYGDAQFWGSTGAIRLNQPVLGISGS
ncbi:MAG TPA: Ig-like domain-containing protein [Acidimicrobiales bacterium]|nr:Ig-like domain-containing protein [Acidimicrobiales bacterium]